MSALVKGHSAILLCIRMESMAENIQPWLMAILTINKHKAVQLQYRRFHDVQDELKPSCC